MGVGRLDVHQIRPKIENRNEYAVNRVVSQGTDPHIRVSTYIL